MALVSFLPSKLSSKSSRNFTGFAGNVLVSGVFVEVVPIVVFLLVSDESTYLFLNVDGNEFCTIIELYLTVVD